MPHAMEFYTIHFLIFIPKKDTYGGILACASFHS